MVLFFVIFTGKLIVRHFVAFGKILLWGYCTLIFDKFKIFMEKLCMVKLGARYNNTSNMIMSLCQNWFKYVLMYF